MYPPVHIKPVQSFSYDRLNMLWHKYPQYHSMTTFSSLEALLEEHESYQKDFDELREEYASHQYDRFLSSSHGLIFPTATPQKSSLKLRLPCLRILTLNPS